MSPRHSPEVTQAIELVSKHAPRIAKVLQETPIVYGPMESRETSGEYVQKPIPHIVLNQHSTPSLDQDTLAAVLIHEGTHALQHRLGELVPGGAPINRTNVDKYLTSEVKAFGVQCRFWNVLHPKGKRPTSDDDVNNNFDAMHYKAGTLDRLVRKNYSEMIASRLIRHGIG